MLAKDTAVIKDEGNYVDPSTSVEVPYTDPASDDNSNPVDTANSFLGSLINYWANLPSNSFNKVSDILTDVASGETSPLEAMQTIAADEHLSKFISPEQYQYLLNMLEQYNTVQDYDRQIHARDTSLSSTISQLQDAGLNTSLIAQLGGAKSGVSSSAADVEGQNVAQAKKMAHFERNTAMAKTLLGLIGGMASAGIYGGSIAASKNAVAKLTTAASKEAARIRATGSIASARVRLQNRMQGKSRYDGNGVFQYHEDYYY